MRMARRTDDSILVHVMKYIPLFWLVNRNKHIKFVIKLNDSLVFEHDGKRINTSAKSGTKFYAQYVSVIGQEKRHIVKCRGFDS